MDDASEILRPVDDSAVAEVPAGYKQTEVGVIPEVWEVSRLEDLSAFITKGSTPTTYGFRWTQTGILFLRSECVGEHGLDLDQSMHITEKAHACFHRSQIQDGDILITITGNVGRVVLLSGIGQANINQHIARVRINSKKADPRYVFQYLSQQSVRSYFSQITTGQAYPQISLKQVRDTLIPLPPIDEQLAMADAMADAEANLAFLEEKVRKASHIKQGMMQQLLTGKVRLV
jgi:type I restriction enzyme S subunit